MLKRGKLMHFVQTTTSDKIILQGLMKNAKIKSKKLIIHIHGMSGNFYENSFIKQMIEDYPNNKVDFLTVETRGSELMRWFYKTDGNPTLIGNAYELIEDSDKDIEAWLNFAIKQGYKEIYLQGHSLGCSKIAYTITKHNLKVKGIILISPSDMHGLRLHPSEIKDHTKRLKQAEKMKKDGKGSELIPGLMWDYAVLSANSYLSIFGEATKVFNFFNPKDGFKILNNIKVPVLAIVGTKDDGICTDAYEAMEMMKKETKVIQTEVYKNAPHSFNGFEKRITNDVLKFLR
jgi:pimeloyl-ACP methyl ester carboxylesterase